MDRKFRQRRLCLIALTAGYSVLNGAEHVTLLPTVWPYLQSLKITEGYWLGFITSVYSFTSAVSGIVGGRLADKCMNHTKTIVISTVAIRILGNFQYIFGGNIVNILFSRFLCGIGNAGETVLLSEVCRTTTRAERTGILALCNGAFDIGTVIGPALQLLMTNLHFEIFSIKVTPLNAPGFLNGIFWTLFLAAVFLFLYNLAEEFAAIESQLTINQVASQSENVFGGSTNSTRTDTIANVHAPPLLLVESSQNLKNVATYHLYLKEFLTDKFVVLLSLAFICNFCVAGFQTVIPVITQDYLNYGAFENSLIYMVGGVEAVVMFFVLAFTSDYISDTNLQFIGWALILLSKIWFLVIIPLLKTGTVVYKAYFLVGVFILFLGNPIAFVANTSLSSKVLSSKTQGLGQGIGRLAIYTGLIYGPAWAGCTVHYTYVFLGVVVAILLINGVMLLGSYKDLKCSESRLLIGSGGKPSSIRGTKESDPLLSSASENNQYSSF